MDNGNQISISVMKRVNVRKSTILIGPWIQFFKVYNFYANTTIR